MNRITESQSRHNLQSRDSWDCSSDHRRHVMAMLLDAATAPSARLCVLGAGNCNDIDLPQLLQSYAEVVLVDIDRQAVEQGVERQFSGIPPHERPAGIRVADVCDVTGIADLLSQAGQSEADVDKIMERIVQRLQSPSGELVSESFDVVASVCLLSQLIFSVRETLGDRPEVVSIIQALRRQHLQFLASMVRPAGAGVLITDFVASNTAPDLPRVANNLLPEYVRQLIQQHNFFTGLNPAVIVHQLQTDPEVAAEIDLVRHTLPWVWDFKVRHYAVCGITFRKRE